MSAVLDDHAVPRLAFRPMRLEDVLEVAQLERDSYRFPWSEGILRDCVRVGYCCRVVEIEHALVGYGIVSVGAGEAHLLNLCVRAAYRTRGIGRRLLEHMFEQARVEGAKELFLEVRPSNTAAIRLYQAMGFASVGLRRGYYQAENGREDAIVMRLDLR
ncbi:MAG: ribosomal-protein-alanine N-acetyltransferase [Gammaproteobacteria bacterium]|jgi:ribosomal-protein-alanine N-acetyltransferase|nr:ribosomal-protein-alanine N-acetyltransferase [Gammaproteobacteria bacterium]NBX40133.1 ribosomal-protein-alanine N-acetyltransferase [Gammaproteobacteria bacterium]